jgi:electron transport complex protein RnfC
MLMNRKMVRKNKQIKKIQQTDKKLCRDRKLERGSVLRRNIGKVVALSSEAPLGNPGAEGGTAPAAMTAGELIAKLEEAQLPGMSGSGFVEAEKIKTFLAANADQKTVLINGAECEPGLLNDAWLMRNRGAQILSGAAILKQALAPARILLASRGSAVYMDGLDTRGVEILRLPLKYPLGEEHFLIEQVLGIHLEKDVLPAARGILVINVQTVYQICRVVNGTYDGGRFSTLADLSTGEARIAYVRSDTSVSDLLAQAFPAARGALYAGGGIGRAERVGAEATFDAATAFAAVVDESRNIPETSCKKCGGCTKRCPMGVSVKDIVRLRQDDPRADISGLGAEKCIHCGTCAYFCPACKNPSGYME